MKRFADAELTGIFSNPRARDQRLVNEQESSEVLWQPLTRRNFEPISPSEYGRKWDALENLTSGGAVSNPAMRAC
jgi:hypothetical protein